MLKSTVYFKHKKNLILKRFNSAFFWTILKLFRTNMIIEFKKNYSTELSDFLTLILNASKKG